MSPLSISIRDMENNIDRTCDFEKYIEKGNGK